MSAGAALTEAFAVLCARDAAAVAVRRGDAVTTRAQLAATAATTAAHLRTTLPAGCTVALAADDGADFLAGLLACLLAEMPVLLLDPGARDAEVAAACDRLGAGAVLRCVSGTADLHRRQTEPWVPLPAGTCIIKLTSGSSGAPRGVAFSAAALAADCRQLARTMGIGGGDRLLATVPMAFSYGLSSLALPVLLAGNEVVVTDGLNPAAALAAAERHAANVLPTVPVFVQTLLRLAGVTRLPASLRLVVSAGAPLPPTAALAFRRRFGQPVHVFYGASECGGICYDRGGRAGERGRVGTAVDGVDVCLDAHGHVRVVSPAVALGYVPDPDTTLGGGAFHAADCARFDGDELRLLGRRCDVLNIGGRKVHPREIETALAAHPQVADCAVVRLDLPGRMTEACQALVVAAPGATLTEPELRSHCHRHLAAHKVPRQFHLVPAIPRTPRGKLDASSVPGTIVQDSVTRS